MSWLFSQAAVEAYSAGNCCDGEPSAQLNVMPTPHKFWRNDKTMEFSNLSQFGLTLRLLTASRGEELLTSYLQGFHAKTLAPQEKVEELGVSEAAFGKRSSGFLTRYDQKELCWKTAQCSLFEGLELSLEIWPRSGSMRNGECWEQRPLEGIAKGNVYGLLPRPQRVDGCKWYVVNQASAQKRIKDGRQLMLIHIVGLTAYTHLNRWLANPPFWEAMMGWPIGWTDFTPLAMDSIRSWQQQHSLYFVNAQDGKDAA
jgi:hypothetical protein